MLLLQVMTKREVTHTGLDELKKPRGRSGLTQKKTKKRGPAGGWWLLMVNDSSFRGLEPPFLRVLYFFYDYFALNFFVHPRRTEGEKETFHYILQGFLKNIFFFLPLFSDKFGIKEDYFSDFLISRRVMCHERKAVGAERD